MIIQNALLVELHPPRIRKGLDVRIEGTEIREIGKNLKIAGEQVIDASGKILMPGLVCSHHHYYSALSRGIMAEIGPTPDFISTLRELWWKLDRALELEDVRISSEIASLEAIKAGCTTVIDHHASPSCIEGSLDAVREGYRNAGLRGASCYEVSERNGTEGEEAGIEENRRMAELLDEEKAQGSWDGLYETMIGGHAPFTISNHALERLGDLVEGSGRGFHVHVAEDRYDVSYSHGVHGKDILVRLDEHGLMNENTIIAHGLYLGSEDIRIMNDRDSFLVSNTRSNMNNSVGYNVHLPELKNWALGTDGIGADMLEELKFAYFKHRDAGGSWFPPAFMEALWKGNIIAERIFGKSFGKIEEGYQADLVILDYPAPTLLAEENLAGHLAFGMNSQAVETVLIAGKPVYEQRKFKESKSALYKEAEAKASEIWKRMDGLKVQ
jgi:putative selenium metabolism protein SsnA